MQRQPPVLTFVFRYTAQPKRDSVAPEAEQAPEPTGLHSNDLSMMDTPDEDQIRDNPYVLSQTVPLGANSFCDSRQEYYHLAPPPKYFSPELLQADFESLPREKDVILAGFDFDESGALICNDKEALEKQKGVLAHVAKQIAMNLLKGLSISHISLPIKIFEPRSSI